MAKKYLSKLTLDTPAQIIHVNAREAVFIEAIGISIGDFVTVLRRAALNGPLHVRTNFGGEFAIGKSLADLIEVDDKT